MRYAARICLAAVFCSLGSDPLEAQASLQTYYSWGYGWHNINNYGGDSQDAVVNGGAPNSHSFGRYPGYVSMAGAGTAQPGYGSLSATAWAYANGENPSIYNDANARWATEVRFHDILTVMSAGQLDFRLLMGADLQLNPGPGDPACASDYRLNFFFGQCARAGAKMVVSGPANATFSTAHTTLAGGPNWASSGLLNVNIGDVLSIDGYFMVGASTCEVYTGFPCDTGGGADASAAGWADFFVDEYEGASFTSASGALYEQSTATPEPASLILLATGLGIIGCVVRRKNS